MVLLSHLYLSLENDKNYVVYFQACHAANGPMGYGPIFNLLFIIIDYDDTMIWIHFLHYYLFCGNPLFVCEFPSDGANDAVLCCLPEQSAEQTVYCPVIWDVMAPIWRLCNITLLHIFHGFQSLSSNVVVHNVNRLGQKLSLTCG